MKPHFVLFGVPIRFGPTVLLIGVLALANITRPELAVGLMAAFIGSVLVHELGHAFAFRHYGCASTVVLHGFGGMTMSSNAQRLTDRQHIVVSLAGPVSQFVLLGLPSLAAWWLFRPSGDLGWLLGIMVLINVGWSLVNLLPLYPLDGGQVLFRTLALHRSVDAWRVTKIVAIAVGVPLGYVAYRAGYTFAMILIGYTVFQGVTAHEQAMAEPQRRPEPAGGEPGDVNARLVGEAYRQLVAGNATTFAPLIDAMSNDPNLSDDVARIRSWHAVLSQQVAASSATPMLAAVTSLDPTQAVPFGRLFSTALGSPEVFPAVVALRQRGLLDGVLGGMDERSLEQLENELVRAGLTAEQVTVARALRLRQEPSGPV